MNILLLLFIFLINYSFQQSNYFQTLQTDFSSLNTTFSTVVISESRDIGSCSCDLTSNACDYLCCCDLDCPTKITETWISNPANICLDKKNLENNYLTHCFNENMLFYFNRKRGMKEYRDPVSNLFCVTFDNSSIMGKFYKDITNLQKSTIDAIYQKYVDVQKKSYYYDKLQTGLILNEISYQVGDYLKMNTASNDNSFIFDGKFFLYQTGSFGECIKTNAVRFMVPIERSTCGFKLKKFTDCSANSWNNLINFNASIADNPSSNPLYRKIKLRNILLRDYETGTLSVTNSTEVGPTFLSATGSECICNNLLESAEFSIIVDPDIFSVLEVYVDLILGTNIRNQCNQKYIMTQSYSTQFLNSISDNYVRSGSPGYEKGNRLLVAYNMTGINGISFNVPKDGIYTIGRKQDGTCTEVQNDGFFIKSTFDQPIIYGINTVYSCQKILNLDNFKIFCENKNWKNLVLYNFITNIQYIGTFGNADYKYLKDWTEVIKDYDISDSTWTENNKTCTFPASIFLDILTSKAGAVNNPQDYIVAAKLSVKYEDLSFLSLEGNDLLNVNMRFIANYVQLTEDQLTATRNAPNIIPGLPADIASPLTAEA